MIRLFLFLVAIIIPVVIGIRGLMLGPGQWLVLNISPCDNPELYWKYEVTRQKINRTHDCFALDINLEYGLNSSYSGFIDVFQKLDGGFKFYQTIESDCACAFLKEHAEENFSRFLRLGNYDPPDCPLPVGRLDVNNFVMDYRELPKHGVYGTFMANAYLVYEGKKVACMMVILNFDERNDEENDDDDDLF